jgi:hypothetical protein
MIISALQVVDPKLILFIIKLFYLSYVCEVYVTVLLVGHPIYCRLIDWLMNDEFDGLWKLSFAAQFVLLFR